MKVRVRRHAIIQPQDQSIKIIPLTQGLNALVDAWNYDRINQHNWSALRNAKSGHFYAVRSERGGLTSMHEAVLGRKYVDHICPELTLDNRESNLRPATPSQQNMNQKIGRRNTSGYKGAHWCGRHKKWRAVIYLDHRRSHLGYFSSREEAARAYDAAADRMFGDRAQLNFPRSQSV